MKLRTDLLSRLVGVQAANYKGEFMGRIVEIKYDRIEGNAQYVILSSNKYFGNRDRYFAIPACAKMIKITRSGKVVLNINDDDLQLAKRVSEEECPKPIFEFDPSIYALYDYRIESENDNDSEIKSEIKYM